MWDSRYESGLLGEEEQEYTKIVERVGWGWGVQVCGSIIIIICFFFLKFRFSVIILGPWKTCEIVVMYIVGDSCYVYFCKRFCIFFLLSLAFVLCMGFKMFHLRVNSTLTPCSKD